jgi:glycosyltransferase involved in cell wall biosynthesis
MASWPGSRLAADEVDAAARVALGQRLQAIADILLGPDTRVGTTNEAPRPELQLELLVQAVQRDCSPDRAWLLCTAVFGAYPTAEDVRASMRALQLGTPAEGRAWLLQAASRTEAALVEQRERTAMEEARSRRAATWAGVATRHPLIGRAGRTVLSETRRRPELHRVARFGWHRFMVLRNGVRKVGVRMRRHSSPPGEPVPTPSWDPELGGRQADDLQLVTEHVVVHADDSARRNLHTGIQQVVRRTLPIWRRSHSVVPVAWMKSNAGWRHLSSAERSRVFFWGRGDPDQADAALVSALVVPWRTVIVLLETPSTRACERLAAIAQYSGNAVVAVGYDCIPVISADLVPWEESERFARYLSVLKYAARIAGISNTATAEFAGFGGALQAQGLPAPAVFGCLLPAEAAPAALEPPPHVEDIRSAAPVVLCVGLEPRKNPLALLYAAERLWREDVDLELRFVAGRGWGEEALRRIAELTAQGRRVSISTALTDAELASAYRDARCTVFVSLDEGYGLPVAESLATGTPVIATDYGSTREIAAGGGALLVDPRDDEAIVDAMLRLLTDDHLLDTLRKEITIRPVRTWQQYASDLWEGLVTPERGIDVEE